MEKFFVLKTVTDQTLAERICASFEDSHIPVLLEHITLSEGNTSASGFRILVPYEHTQTALALVGTIENKFYSESHSSHQSFVVH